MTKNYEKYLKTTSFIPDEECAKILLAHEKRMDAAHAPFNISDFVRKCIKLMKLEMELETEETEEEENV